MRCGLGAAANARASAAPVQELTANLRRLAPQARRKGRGSRCQRTWKMDLASKLDAEPRAARCSFETPPGRFKTARNAETPARLPRAGHELKAQIVFAERFRRNFRGHSPTLMDGCLDQIIG